MTADELARSYFTRATKRMVALQALDDAARVVRALSHFVQP